MPLGLCRSATRVALQKLRRELLECWHLLLRWLGTVLQQMPLAVLAPAPRAGLRFDGRLVPFPVTRPVGEAELNVHLPSAVSIRSYFHAHRRSLAGLVAAVIALVAIRLEEIPPAVGQGNGAVLRADRRRANQPVVLQTLEGSLRALRVVAKVMKIALGNDSKRPDGRQRAAFLAVDLVHSVALANRSSLTSARQVEVLREDVARVRTLSISIPAIRRASAETALAVRTIARIITPSRVVEHTVSDLLTRLSAAVSLFRKRPSGRVGLSGVMRFSVEG